MLNLVTPANAGVQNILKRPDTGFRRYDGKTTFSTFYETAKIDGFSKRSGVAPMGAPKGLQWSFKVVMQSSPRPVHLYLPRLFKHNTDLKQTLRDCLLMVNGVNSVFVAATHCIFAFSIQ